MGRLPLRSVGLLDPLEQSRGVVGGEDHRLHDGEALGLEEHVFGAAEANALRAIRTRALGVSRVVAVGPHLQPARAVGPMQDFLEVFLIGEVGLDGVDLPDEHFARRSVDGDEISLANDLGRIFGGHRSRLEVDGQRLGSGDAGLTHSAGDDGGVAGRATLGGENAPSLNHSMNVIGRCLGADEQHGFGFSKLGGGVGVEDGFAGRGSRRRVETLGQQLAGGRGLILGLGIGTTQEAIERRGWARREGSPFSDRSASRTMSAAILTAAAAVRFPARVCSMQRVPRSIVNSRSCMS